MDQRWPPSPSFLSRLREEGQGTVGWLRGYKEYRGRKRRKGLKRERDDIRDKANRLRAGGGRRTFNCKGFNYLKK